MWIYFKRYNDMMIYTDSTPTIKYDWISCGSYGVTGELYRRKVLEMLDLKGRFPRSIDHLRWTTSCGFIQGRRHCNHPHAAISTHHLYFQNTANCLMIISSFRIYRCFMLDMHSLGTSS